MRIALCFAVLAVVMASSIAPADEPRLGPALAEGIARQLLSADAKERAAGEAALEKATPETLKSLVLTMRDRAAGGAPKPAAEPEPAQVFLDASLLSPARCDLARWGLSCGGAPRRMSEADATALRDRAARSGHVVVAPKILALDGQEASIAVGERTSYISDHEVSVTQEGPMIVDPIVEAVASGFEMRITPTVADDRAWVTCILDIAHTALQDMRREVVPLPWTDRTVEVQRPDVVSRRWQTRAGLRSGEAILLLAPEGYSEDGSPRALLLSARVLDQGK